MDAFDLHKTEESQFSHYEIMRDNFQLQADEDSLRKMMSIMKSGFITSIGPNFMYYHKPIGQSIKMLSNNKWVSKRLKKGLAEKPTREPMDIAIQQVQNMQTFAQSNLTSLETRQDKLKTTRLEWHKKFTTSLAILVMFLIGAPLGAIIKKGGFGIPVVVAVSFFILMYILTSKN